MSGPPSAEITTPTWAPNIPVLNRGVYKLAVKRLDMPRFGMVGYTAGGINFSKRANQTGSRLSVKPVLTSGSQSQTGYSRVNDYVLSWHMRLQL